MKRSPYFWFWKVLSGCFDIVFFGGMGYYSGGYIFRTPNTEWILLPIAWTCLCSSLIVPPFKFYHFAKSLYSKDGEASRSPSDFTSVQARIDDRQSAVEVSTPDAQDVRIEHRKSAGWLSPLPLDPARKKVRERQTTWHVSNLGCLPMTLDDYFKLVDWTGRQVRKGKTGHVPAECDPILDRLQCDAATCLDFVKSFRNEAGLAPSRQLYRNLLRPLAAILTGNMRRQSSEVTCPRFL